MYMLHVSVCVSVLMSVTFSVLCVSNDCRYAAVNIL